MEIHFRRVDEKVIVGLETEKLLYNQDVLDRIQRGRNHGTDQLREGVVDLEHLTKTYQNLTKMNQ